MKKWFVKRNVVALLTLMLCLCLAGCVGNQETVLTIGVYSGSYWNTPNGNCYQILDDVITLFEESHLGDPNQIDRSFLDERTNGLSYASEHMKGSPLCWQITMSARECERSALAMEAVKRL